MSILKAIPVRCVPECIVRGLAASLWKSRHLSLGELFDYGSSSSAYGTSVITMPVSNGSESRSSTAI